MNGDRADPGDGSPFKLGTVESNDLQE
jgi:hypothetical protein